MRCSMDGAISKCAATGHTHCGTIGEAPHPARAPRLQLQHHQATLKSQPAMGRYVTNSANRTDRILSNLCCKGFGHRGTRQQTDGVSESADIDASPARNQTIGTIRLAIWSYGIFPTRPIRRSNMRLPVSANCCSGGDSSSLSARRAARCTVTTGSRYRAWCAVLVAECFIGDHRCRS